MVVEISSCSCSLPPGSTYFHCRACCSTYTTLELWDAHRSDGRCYNLEGVYEEDGVYSTSEGHEKRRTLSARFKSMWKGRATK